MNLKPQSEPQVGKPYGLKPKQTYVSEQKPKSCTWV